MGRPAPATVVHEATPGGGSMVAAPLGGSWAADLSGRTSPPSTTRWPLPLLQARHPFPVPHASATRSGLQPSTDSGSDHRRQRWRRSSHQQRWGRKSGHHGANPATGGRGGVDPTTGNGGAWYRARWAFFYFVKLLTEVGYLTQSPPLIALTKKIVLRRPSWLID
jgi:hypothetical protein